MVSAYGIQMFCANMAKIDTVVIKIDTVMGSYDRLKFFSTFWEWVADQGRDGVEVGRADLRMKRTAMPAPRKASAEAQRMIMP